MGERKKVILKEIFHRGKECLALFFEKDPAIETTIKARLSAKWSRTKKCWYVVYSEYNKAFLMNYLPTMADLSLAESGDLPGKKAAATLTLVKAKVDPAHENSNKAGTLSEENEQSFREYEKYLLLKGYSESTRRTYCNEFHCFLEAIKQHSAKDLRADQLQRYILYCVNSLKLSENTIHSRMNALKFYYEQVLRKEKMFFDIPRPKKRKLLPVVFSQDEVAAIINGVTNKKHKAMLMLAYSAGLRVSEVVSIKTYQVDSKRMTIFISQAKGKKDRVVGLSPVLLIMLREYAKAYKPDKRGYLFEGSRKGSAYSTRSLQEVLQAAKARAGILKPGSIHSLRHSFATHLIDRGTDVTMIQKLLGHNNIKTTLIYLHTTNKDLTRVISPLDDLKLL